MYFQAPDASTAGRETNFKLPRTLEECQRKIIALQASNAELQSRNVSGEIGTILVPDAEYQEMRTRASVMEQTQQQMKESDRLNTHLQQTIQELRQGKVNSFMLMLHVPVNNFSVMLGQELYH